MNGTTLEGQGQSLAGTVKEGIGNATRDRDLQAEGTTDRFKGDAKQMIGSAKDALGAPGPLVDKAKAFAKDRPWAAAALVGTIALAVFNSLKGK
jgi:uncharacterized protein YjbJ (UPF0337 family)